MSFPFRPSIAASRDGSNRRATTLANLAEGNQADVSTKAAAASLKISPSLFGAEQHSNCVELQRRCMSALSTSGARASRCDKPCPWRDLVRRQAAAGKTLGLVHEQPRREIGLGRA